MLHFALIGEKLGHSLSVPIHTAIHRALGVSADYRLIEIPAPQLITEFPPLAAKLDGFNVTIPYKRAVIPLLSRLDPTASAVGAVNTVRCRDAVGFNTDAAGFAAMLDAAGIDARQRNCFVLGTGGAALAVRYALTRLGAASVTFVSRRPDPRAIGYDELPERFSGLLINATPVGMFPNEADCPLDEGHWRSIAPRCEAVADVIYRPRETVLLRRAKAAGMPAANGLRMLVSQAAEAERIWLNRGVPQECLDKICEELDTCVPI